jgi:hypothetical protein
VAQNITAHRGSNIDGRATRHAGYQVSQVIRKRTDEPNGWIKLIAGMAQTKHRGLVGCSDGLVEVAELANQFGNCIGCIVKLTEIPNLARPISLGYRSCISRLGDIDPNKYFPTSPHGSSPVR